MDLACTSITVSNGLATSLPSDAKFTCSVLERRPRHEVLGHLPATLFTKQARPCSSCGLEPESQRKFSLTSLSCRRGWMWGKPRGTTTLCHNLRLQRNQSHTTNILPKDPQKCLGKCFLGDAFEFSTLYGGIFKA